MNAPLPVEPRLIKGSVRDEDTGCLVWMRSANSRGYGLIGVDGHVELVHRAAYAVWVGPIPDGLQIDHVYDNGCRSRLCIEPSHLEPVTNLENQRRSLRSRQTHCLRNHPLSGDNVRFNRNGHRSCITCRDEAHRRETAKRRVTADPGTVIAGNLVSAAATGPSRQADLGRSNPQPSLTTSSGAR